jgi:hypothetical protein
MRICYPVEVLKGVRQGFLAATGDGSLDFGVLDGGTSPGGTADVGFVSAGAVHARLVFTVIGLGDKTIGISPIYSGYLSERDAAGLQLFAVHYVPEPMTAVLIGLGLVMLAIRGRPNPAHGFAASAALSRSRSGHAAMRRRCRRTLTHRPEGIGEIGPVFSTTDTRHSVK